MALTAIVGDVHGCASELEDLVREIGYSAQSDQLILVGDLVARGPDSRGVLDLVRRLRARAVRGNHDEKLLAWHERGKDLSSEHERVARQLSEKDWRTLGAMPLWIDLPEHGARVVHAGVLPGVPVEKTPADAPLRMRTIDARGEWSDDADA
ncbi:MAG: metallophosphoesterase, partial [Myxococcales bacterium]|nr:metallophosphoesterase [Myxococcales bacterium]